MKLNKHQIPTPALLVDLDLFEKNLARMAGAAKNARKKLRPHVKAHKCSEIAKRQIASGAFGMCCATVPEAEMLARAGVEELLITSPLADPLKMRRAVATGAMVVVDHLRQVEWYQEAARETGTQLPILVDLDVGDHRTGVASIESALEIAKAIDSASHLWLRGAQAYSVSGSHGATTEDRRKNSLATYGLAAAARDEFARHGMLTDILSGGSTGTWDVDLAIDDLTELQAGSYPLMDLAYRNIGIDFENSMTVLATVISANHGAFVTIDAGFKAFSTDRAFGPEAIGKPGPYRWGGDEFGYLDGTKLKLGDRIELIPPHCDPTVNLYDRIYACRGDEVEEIWKVKE